MAQGHSKKGGWCLWLAIAMPIHHQAQCKLRLPLSLPAAPACMAAAGPHVGGGGWGLGGGGLHQGRHKERSRESEKRQALDWEDKRWFGMRGAGHTKDLLCV